MSTALVQPYSGAERLVIGVDVGTTSSGVALCHLQPGAIPTIRTVTSWPESPTESKLPSLVLFDSTASPVAFGAECLTLDMKARTTRKELHLAKWFKLHLHPREMQFDSTATLSSSLGGLNLGSSGQPLIPAAIVPDLEVPPLPPHVTIKLIYSAFLRYLLEHTKNWFAEHSHEGAQTWARLIGEAQIVMAIPDGWDEVQQATMRQALVETKLLGEGVEESLEFVREAEASVHFALKGEEVREWLKPGALFTVADLGGSTIDVCLYRCEQISPTIQLKEVKLSDSVQAGGVFVDRAAETLINAKLEGSRFASTEIIDRIVTLFEEKTKRRFVGSGEISYIKFGDSSDTDRRHGVNMGRLSLTTAEVESTFATCTNEILAAVEGQLRMGNEKASHLIVTGGFGDSPYLRDRLHRFLEPSGFHVSTSDDQSKKAVAEGAVRWCISSAVDSRLVRVTYGSNIEVRHDISSVAHQGRPILKWADGATCVPGAWLTIVRKDTVLKSNASFEQNYMFQTPKLDWLSRFRAPLYVYYGDEYPQWCENKDGGLLPDFQCRFEVEADLSQLHSALTPYKTGSRGVQATAEDVQARRAYYHVNFNLRLFVAQTSLKARLTWTERGVHREGPATVVLVDSTDRIDGAQTRRRLPADIVAEHA